MEGYVLSCCSTADLTKEHFDERNINYTCFHYEMDGVAYLDDLWQTKSCEEFYQAMVDGAETKTSQINAEEYAEYFEGFLKEGKDVLHLCLSSGISGSINSAMIAKSMLEEQYPDRKLYIVDSLAASSGYGLIMDKLADMRDEGKGIDELYEWIENNKLKLHHWFLSMDLTFYIKGGRISKTSGVVGGILGICPLLNVSNEGKLVARYKIKGKKKVLKKIVEKMEEFAENGYDYSQKCYICHSMCLEDAEYVASLIEEKFPKLNGKVEINNIGTTIGSHTGPGTLALFFWGDERID